VILSLCEKYGKHCNQIVLRWATQRGFSVIPKSSQREHIHQNIQFGDFTLTDAEMEAINGLNCMFKTDWDPKDEI
jgi:diketogulonate reductase-like aldo/keto reductase